MGVGDLDVPVYRTAGFEDRIAYQAVVGDADDVPQRRRRRRADGRGHRVRPVEEHAQEDASRETIVPNLRCEMRRHVHA